MSKRTFIVIGHEAPVDGAISLNDLPGSGRCDELVRCVTAGLLTSNGVRRDTELYLVLQGEEATRIILWKGEGIRNLNPDERSTAALLRKALSEELFIFEREVHPGIRLVSGDLRGLLCRLQGEMKIIHLVEDGVRAIGKEVIGLLRGLGAHSGGFGVLLSDRIDLTEEEAVLVRDACESSFSLGPVSLQSHQAIIVLHNLLDRGCDLS